jgi:selenide,water dikinase
MTAPSTTPLSQPIRLTQTVKKGGCAAKIPALALRQMLQQVSFPSAPPNLIVDAGLFDDAAVIQVSPEMALVLTLDFFTPIVDSPRLFGQIAAANALSDIYAMGGEPMTAMSIFAFPTSTLDESIGVEVLNGATDILKQASTPLVGGHSIDDDTLKFGLSVMGRVHPQQIWKNSGAKSGDVLILTKALGTGTLTAGLKNNHWSEEALSETWASMTTLNALSLSPRLRENIHAATDITGFGLVGHALQMARASHVSLQITSKDVPGLPLALESIELGFLTKAHRTNREYTEAAVTWANTSPSWQLLCQDPQTSGGLLLSVNAEAADQILSEIKTRFPKAAMIGRVQEFQNDEPRIYFS